ncbi:MAG: ChaN family lipoprotein [Weeksellaceae bacterium]|nr:ChaN family lipoprotein [Weeksellaceae bacterium]
MKKIISFTSIILILFSCSRYHKNETDLLKSIKENSQSPEHYVIEKFKNHQVIFIGENHYIKEQVELIKNLIPELYENGIYNLGTEFIRYSDTEKMNKLLTDSIYNEELVRDISFNSLWHWGYQEYLDIYKTVWELNQKLPKNAPKFRIFGIEEDIDFSYVQSEEDFDNPEVMRKVFKSSYDFEESEGFSAFVIQKEILDKNEKALIYSGIHHAFTEYYQPRYDIEKKIFGGSYEKERMGNLIKNKLGDKTMTIFIHGPWYDKNGYKMQILPIDGVLDSLFSLPEYQEYYPFGMDTRGTSLGDLKGKTSVYQYGYPNFTLKDFCDGYIFLKPINDYTTVTPIADFVKPENVEYIKQQEFNYRNTDLTAQDFNDTIKAQLKVYQKEIKMMK